MLTKDVLDEIIKRRYDEGKTLSIERIDGEIYSNWQIRDAARKFYGGWADARNEVVGVSKYGHKPDMSKEEVIAELRRLQSQGHSMKSGDFEPWFYRRIVEHFGGYKQAKKELGITTKRKETPYEVTESRKASSVRRRKYSDEYLVEEVRGFIHKYDHLGEVYDNESKIMSAITRRFGNIHKLAEEYSIMLPPVKSRRKWTDERIRNELKEAVEKVKSTASTRLIDSGYRSLVDAVNRHYGTWNAGLVAFGYEVAYEYRDPSDNLTKEETKEKVLNALARGIKPTRGALEKEIKGLRRSIDANFGGIDELKKYCGFCAIDDEPSKKEMKVRMYRPDLTTVEGIKREIIRMRSEE